MQQIYCSNNRCPIKFSRISFFLNAKGRLSKIIWRDTNPETSWGNEERETWDFNDANENDLIRAFKELALGNPDDFKKLYYVLKEHDEVTFPCIQQTLKEVQGYYNFD